MDMYVGIDVGKAMLDVAISGESRVRRFPNTPAGWADLRALLAHARQPCIVLEATGRYHEGVTAALAAAGTPVTVANPLHTAAFRLSEAQLAKTDAIDAKVLEAFAAQKQPAPTPLPDPVQRHVRDLVRTRDDLVKAQTQLTLQASEAPAGTVAYYAALRDPLAEQLARLEQEIAAHIAAHPALAERAALLQTVPGLGPVSAASLLGELPELGTLSRRQIASLGGLAPRNRQSGKQAHRPTVRGGRAMIRRTLYLVAAGATMTRRTGQCARGAESIRGRYDALLDRGKPLKVARIAVARWLLTILNVMVREGLRWEQTRAAQGGGVTG